MLEMHAANLNLVVGRGNALVYLTLGTLRSSRQVAVGGIFRS